MTDDFDPQYWEKRYAGQAPHGDLEPNPVLVAEAGRLTAGRALDAGCGEGANALWLAGQGWRVTAVDVSPTALDRARAHAAETGEQAAARIDWLHADLTAWEPPTRAYDLVTSHYVHPGGDPAAHVRRLAGAVAPGGTLLVVDHSPDDRHAHAHTTPEELTAGVPEEGWTVEVAETRRRHASPGHGHGHGHGPDQAHGHGNERSDVILRARRQ